MLESLKANDAIIVSEFSRLGRNMLECLEILSVAAQKRINWLHSAPRDRDGIVKVPNGHK